MARYIFWHYLLNLAYRFAHLFINKRFRNLSDEASDIIIGAAVNYKVANVESFITSLKSSGYKGRAILFIEDLTSATASYLRKNHIELQWYRGNTMPIHNYRFFCFQQFMEKQHGVSRVMLTDVRDVIFQGDPFGDCRDDKLYVFGENSSVKLAQCPYNSSWIQSLYGKNVLEKLSDEIIICCGVTIGGYRNILYYLNALCQELSIIPPIFGADTGAHNVLIRNGRIPNVVMSYNESGLVYTLHHVHPNKIQIDNEGFIVNDSGRPSVVHQYDRHPVLVTLIKNRK